MSDRAVGGACHHARRVVEGVILDAGGVILHPDLDWLAACAAAAGLAADRAALHAAYYRTIYDVDCLTAPGQSINTALTTLEIRGWFFGHMLQHAGLAAARVPEVAGRIAERAAREFPRESDIYHYALPGMRQQLQRLRDAGWLLAVASNNDGALEDQLRSVGVHELFVPGALKDSGVEGVAKPDPELVLRAARALGVEPARCVFVGDVDRVDGAAARAAGMPFALLDPLAQPRPTRPLCVPDLDALRRYFVVGDAGPPVAPRG